MKDVIELNETEVVEVDQAAEVKPAKKIKVLGRKITIEKAEKPAKEPKAKKAVGKKILDITQKVLIVGAVAVGTGVAVGIGKTIVNAKRDSENPEQEDFPELDQATDDNIVGWVDTEVVEENPVTETVEE